MLLAFANHCIHYKKLIHFCFLPLVPPGRPKIQRIVWSDKESSPGPSQPSHPAPSRGGHSIAVRHASPTPYPLMQRKFPGSAASHLPQQSQQRKFHGGQTTQGPYRGQRGGMMGRGAHRGGVQRGSGQPRGRGLRGTKRGHYHSHRQQDF